MKSGIIPRHLPWSLMLDGLIMIFSFHRVYAQAEKRNVLLIAIDDLNALID